MHRNPAACTPCSSTRTCAWHPSPSQRVGTPHARGRACNLHAGQHVLHTCDRQTAGWQGLISAPNGMPHARGCFQHVHACQHVLHTCDRQKAG